MCAADEREMKEARMFVKEVARLTATPVLQHKPVLQFATCQKLEENTEVSTKDHFQSLEIIQKGQKQPCDLWNRC